MTRRALATALVLTLLGLPALAQTDFATPQIDRLESEGYSVSDVRRTLLGRILIVSKNRTNLREVVLDRYTGALLRDRLFPLPTTEITSTPPTQPQTGPGMGQAGTGAGSPGASGGGAGAGDGNGNGGAGNGAGNGGS